MILYSISIDILSLVHFSKSITIRINQGTEDEKSFQMVRGKDLVEERNSPFKIRYSGLYVFIDTDFGLSIQWDKGTLVYVKLGPEHSRKVQGLCGNFDPNSTNDIMRTRGRLALMVTLTVTISID